MKMGKNTKAGISHEELLQAVLDATRELNDDTSVPKETTIESLREVALNAKELADLLENDR